MPKKIVISILMLLWANSLGLAGYRLFESEAASTVNESGIATATFNGQSDSVMIDDIPVPLTVSTELEAGHTYYFCEPDNPDCDYIEQIVLKDLAKELDVETLDNITYINILSIDTDWNPQRLQNQWGFDRVPALITVDENNEYHLLTWNPDDPLNSTDVKNWMIANNIWTGAQEDIGELLDPEIE